jgi:cell division protein FtsL
MAKEGDPIAERVLAQVPGWLFLLVGLTLVALAVLTPAWMGCQRSAWRHEVMQARAEAAQREHRRYQQFHTALKQGDPLLLERLAYAQLRMKPTDTRLAGPPADSPVPGGSDARPRTGPTGEPAMLPIVDWLAVPMPRVGQQLDPFQPRDTRLTRLATGPSRWVMLAAGLLFAVAGLAGGPRRAEAS